MKNLIILVLAVCFAQTPVIAAAKISKHKTTYETKVYKEKHAKGLKRNHKKLKELKAKAHKKMAFSGSVIPSHTDLTSLVSPPENQGSCGSCWDFGITKALRSAFMLVGNDPGRLAFNYLLNNCGKGPSQGGCNGGDFDAGQSFLDGGSPCLRLQTLIRNKKDVVRIFPQPLTAQLLTT